MKRLISIMITAILATCMTSAHGQEVEAFVNNLLEQYPKARLLDIYKSSFQDYMGAEHLVNDTASARAYLEREISTTDLDRLMPWYYEPCGPEGRHVRVSLRAIHEGRITADALLDAFIASANGAHPSIASWAGRWHEIIQAIDGMGLQLPYYIEDKEFIDGILRQGKYAISHSPEYREAYAPHYRIVERQIFEERIKPLLP